MIISRYLIALKRFAIVFAVALFSWGAPASADLNIDITKSEFDPMKIAIPNFLDGNGRSGQFARDMASVIRADLERSGLFEIIDPAAYIETQRDVSYQPDFPSWRVISAEALVSGRVAVDQSNQVTVEFRLWDIYGQEQLSGSRLRVSADSWRRVAHKISDRIYERITGESGYFDSRIVFISESGPKTDRIKKLRIMDQDGENIQTLLTGSDLALTPRFSPDTDRNGNQTIAYLSYETGRPEVYLQEISLGTREKLGNFEGMTTSPRFSSQGDVLLFTQITRGNSDIHTYDLRSRTVTALTTNPGIDTSPSFSPDSQRITFNSDRSGSPQIYIMNANGSNPKRISFGDGRYTTPIWSPRGDKIAFTKSLNGRFHIGVMNIDGSGERLLTDSYLDDGPTWSPNGRVILFTRESRGASGVSEIWSIDLTGRNLRKLPTAGPASDPAWSPLLP